MNAAFFQIYEYLLFTLPEFISIYFGILNLHLYLSPSVSLCVNWGECVCVCVLTKVNLLFH